MGSNFRGSVDGKEAIMATRIVSLVTCLSLTPALLYLYLSDRPSRSEKSLDLSHIGCKEQTSLTETFSRPNWNGWSNSPSNSRFQDRIAAGLDGDLVPRLKLKWAFAYPGDVLAYAQPTVVADHVFVGSAGGKIYSLSASTGCVYWAYSTNSGVRSAITIGPLNDGASFAAYFGDQSGNVYAVDALTGKLLWKTTVEKHPTTRITGAPRFFDGRLYVPVASGEEASASSPAYECCTFRGSVVALDAATGKQIWKTYTIPQASRQVGKNNKGAARWAPSGAGVWASPTLDVSHRTLYVTTGDSYSSPAAETIDAIIALNMDSGKILWVRQLLNRDAWNFACNQRDRTNCPEDDGPDYDFGSSAILVAFRNGRRALVAGQKSGIVHAVDPDREGQILWQVRAGRGGTVGGIAWGPAADDKNLYVAISDIPFGEAEPDPKVGGGLLAFQLTDGKQLWHAHPAKCPDDRKGCSPGQSAAVTVIPGVVFSGSLDGHLRAYSTTDGRVLWDYDTAHDFKTVNGAPGRGGALNGPGPTVVGGMLFVNSGYGILGQMPGNVLLAFSVE
jgi:polyvinyl alcohol dehydrogenase (cytochrome)